MTEGITDGGTFALHIIKLGQNSGFEPRLTCSQGKKKKSFEDLMLHQGLEST